MDLAKLIFEEKFNDAKKWIIENNADLNSVNDQMNTPLLAAIDADDIKFVRFLLEKGANPNYLEEGVNLPLNYAIEISVEAEDYLSDINEVETEVIELLLEYGANIKKKDNFGRSPYDFAKNYHVPARKLFEKLSTKK